MTPNDEELLKRLVKIEEAAYRSRHVFLVLGIICIVVAFGGFAFLLSMSREKAMQFGSHPISYLLAICGGGALGYAARARHGHPAYRLLISIARQHLAKQHGAQQGAQADRPASGGPSA